MVGDSMAGSATRGKGRRRRDDAAVSGRAARAAARRVEQAAPKPITLPTTTPVTAALGRRRLVVLLAITLYVFGLVMVASASSGELLLQDIDQWTLLKKQAIFGVVGLSAMWVTMRMPLELVRRLARPAVWACFALVVIVMIPGVGHSANGATRWINFGFFQLQPSEPLKLAICALLAAHLARTPPPRHWLNDFVRSPGGAALLLAGLLVALQSDLGSGLVVGGVTLVLYVLAGTQWKLLWRTIGPAVALVVLSIVTEPYRRERFLAFIDPWADPYGNGHQLIQAQLAIGSGGPFGVGLGQSVQKINFLPEAHTDMIFAITGEELGLFAVVLVLGSFALLAGLGAKIARQARTRFSALLAVGITAMIVGQAIVNIAGVTGFMPLTGIPLPLISYGGSSLIITLASLGLLANIATERRPSRSFVLAEHEPDDVDDVDEDSDDYDVDSDWA
jgi:cell division protein FtsW